jgi:hypothetical protein
VRGATSRQRSTGLEFLLKKSTKVSKNADFHADFESVEKVVKKWTQKSYKQNKFDEHE